MAHQLDHYINGQTRPPSSGVYLDSFEPLCGQASGAVAAGNAEDVAVAVEAASAAQAAWRARRPIERGRIMLALAAKIREQSAALSEIERRETGKPPWQAAAEIEVAAQYFEFYGGLVNVFQGEKIDLGSGYHSYTSREPYGVVGVITPWNAPLNQAGRAVAPALAAGNTVVLKPSEFTSGTSVAVARIAVEECGMPPGVLNVVLGAGADCGSALVSHPLVRKVAFTGSPPGRSADRPHRRRPDHPSDPGAGWKIAEYHFRRRQSRSGYSGRGSSLHHQCWTGVSCRDTAAGPALHP